MSEEEIRNYLSRQATAGPEAPARKMRVVRRARPAPRPEQAPDDTFKDFSASHMFCATCRRAMPVRERLMLYLPDGDLYDYSCTGCGTSTGTRKVGR